MIVLDLELKGIYGFNDFHINFSYPKKIVNSIIDQEHLKGRERFRYKKAVILMGANATGKTSLGKALLRIFGYMTDGNPTPLYEMVAGDRGYFSIDFVNGDYRLQRLSAQIDASNQEIDIQYQTADIDTMDSYEKCVKKLKDQTIEATRTATALKKLVGAVRYRFLVRLLHTNTEVSCGSHECQLFFCYCTYIICDLHCTVNLLDEKSTIFWRNKESYNPHIFL